MKKIAFILFIVLSCFTACAKNSIDESEEETIYPLTEIHKPDTEDQIAPPEPGETVAEIKIKDYGSIKVKFFPLSAPKAVENFVTLAENEYYDGVIFHRVLDDFMIQGGDPTGTGTGGNSIWDKRFEDEFSEKLIPIRGALCMANSGRDSNGSQFFIVQTEDSNERTMTEIELTEEQKNLFMEYGGTPWLVNKHTVFGQVYEGIEIVDQIAAAVADQQGRPTNDIIIDSIEVFVYK